MKSRIAWLVVVAACGSHPAGGDGDGGAGGIDAPGTGTDAVSFMDASSCQAPDMLIVLDHTLSMADTPQGAKPANTPAGHMLSKWYIAVTAVKALTAQLDTTIRFGLELFPLNPNNGTCVTLTQEINGHDATNPSCQTGEIDVAPDISEGAAINAFLDPETTELCISTPIGKGLQAAQTELTSVEDPIRKQFVLLLTDGQDTCAAGLPLTTVQALAASGVETYVIGFGTTTGADGVDVSQLNNLACAGHTATDFATKCKADASGNYSAIAPATGTLFLLASDAASLTTALMQSAGQVCCGCIA